jgi:peptidoglycan-associated lipoprotein
MLTRSSRLLTLALLIAAATLSGCAKRPATTAASAPPPSAPPAPAPARAPAPAPATRPAPAPAQPPAAAPAPRPAPPTAAPAPRPAPKEFAENPNIADIFFDFDKYDVRPGDAKTLDASAAWLKQNRGELILIEGHCDERGTPEYNLALGERRAKAAMNYLVAQGIEANRITIISYGEERPQCAEKNEACWQKNRRDHFLTKPR